MNRKYTWIVIFMVIGALVVSAFSLVAITNENNEASLQRGREADAARYTAMAEHYLGSKSSILAGIEADTARYMAMAEYYTGQSVLAGTEADAARYTAMARYYDAKNSQPALELHYGPPGR